MMRDVSLMHQPIVKEGVQEWRKWILPSCFGSFCRSTEDLGSPHAKSLTGLLQQFLCDGEVHQSRVDVLVAEVRGQIGETRLGIDAFPVPGQHPVHDEGMPQIMDAKVPYVLA